MEQYVLGMYQPDGETPPARFLEEVMRQLGELNQEMVEAGAWVSSLALHPVSAATVVSSADRAPGGDVVVTDGPYAESKEHLGGFWLIQAPDLDAALGWAERIVKITTLPIEVRPVRLTITV
ncbi:YciI family protein [Spongisporangium articulatum]|uniref:YciI family protein n=1 Tax=Spongisporangium articulatum TaxID=3362603 RepID=A0ABW8ALI8_9ACTN